MIAPEIQKSNQSTPIHNGALPNDSESNLFREGTYFDPFQTDYILNREYLSAANGSSSQDSVVRISFAVSPPAANHVSESFISTNNSVSVNNQVPVSEPLNVQAASPIDPGLISTFLQNNRHTDDDFLGTRQVIVNKKGPRTIRPCTPDIPAFLFGLAGLCANGIPGAPNLYTPDGPSVSIPAGPSPNDVSVVPQAESSRKRAHAEDSVSGTQVSKRFGRLRALLSCSQADTNTLTAGSKVSMNRDTFGINRHIDPESAHYFRGGINQEVFLSPPRPAHNDMTTETPDQMSMSGEHSEEGSQRGFTSVPLVSDYNYTRKLRPTSTDSASSNNPLEGSSRSLDITITTNISSQISSSPGRTDINTSGPDSSFTETHIHESFTPDASSPETPICTASLHQHNTAEDSRAHPIRDCNGRADPDHLQPQPQPQSSLFNDFQISTAHSSSITGTSRTKGKYNYTGLIFPVTADPTPFERNIAGTQDFDYEMHAAKRREFIDQNVCSIDRTRFTRHNVNILNNHHPDVVYTKNPKFDISRPYSYEFLRTEYLPGTTKLDKTTRAGSCAYCEDLTFYNLGSSSYGNHMALQHGITTKGYLYPQPFSAGNYMVKKDKNKARTTTPHPSLQTCVMCAVCGELCQIKTCDTGHNERHLSYLLHFKSVHHNTKKMDSFFDETVFF